MRAPRPITLVLYDEHLMCLEGLAAALDEDPTVAIVAITTRRDDLADILEQRRPDICLVDVTTPDSACAHELGALARRSPTTAVVAIVDEVPPNFARHVIGAGVRGFARRDASLRSLRQAIGRVAAGHPIGGPDLTRRAATRPTPSGPRTQLSHAGPTIDRLTDREREVLERMMTGEDTRHIAVALDISRSTARTHVQNVRRKLGARTRLQAVAVALGTVAPPPKTCRTDRPAVDGDRLAIEPYRRELRQPPVDSIRILLLDRSRLSADALGRRLVAEDDVSGVRTAASAAEALRALGEESFTVVVATADLARELRAAPADRVAVGADVPIVVLADADTEQQAPDLFRAGGIAGWVSRYRSSDALMDAIRTCLRGDVFLPRNVLARLADQSPPADTSRSARDRVLATLTEREVEILLLLEQGLGRYEIATRLHLSPNTVRTHIQRILRRLNVHSTLAALALLRAG